MLIDDALKDLEERKERILSWRDAETVALEVKERFSGNALEIDVGLDWIFAWEGMKIHVHKVRNINDLNPIFRFLAQSGYERKNGPNIYDEIKQVTWNYNKIELTVFFDSDEPDACKFIKTGTKEVDVYKIDCPGLE